MSARGAGGTGPGLPSIGRRLARALASWTVVWGLAVGAAVWFVSAEEVDELLDDVLETSAGLLAAIARDPAVLATVTAEAAGTGTARTISDHGLDSFAWQIVAADGRVRLRSQQAPAEAWQATASAGFSHTAQWRLFGIALGSEGHMLYTAQTQAERRAARAETALGATLVALAAGLLGYAWLRWRVRTELRPLQLLSQKLATLDPDSDAGSTGAAAVLGPAERRELQPMHQALDALMQRLAARVATERAFSAHAAHALRTPLAGIDAQLAVALRECPPGMHKRLQLVRDGTTRLQGVVTALLGLFRTGSQLHREAVDVAALLARLPVAGLQVQVSGGTRLDADADLLAVALVNLLDNASRHGAGRLSVDLCAPQRLRLADDGPGITDEHRAALQAALDAQAYEGTTGLGLMIADRVARAHGGRLHLAGPAPGFAVELQLGPAGAAGFREA